jgi:uncharacterized protein YoxC
MAVEQVIKISLDDLKALGGIDNLKKSLGETEQSTKSLKQQLREATAEVAQMAEKYGEASKETVQAAKRAAELKDRIEDANDAIMAFKGEGAFLATGKALQSVASGFAAAQGAMGLFGSESENVEKAILKVQSAMALAQGLEGLEDAGRAFTQLKTVAINAFNGIKAAIGATGIGALVIALGTVYYYWDDIKEAVSGVSEEQQRLNEKTAANLEISKKNLDSLNSQDNILKLQGKSEKQILDLKIKKYAIAIKDAKANLTAVTETNRLAYEGTVRNANLTKKILNAIAVGGLQAIRILTDPLDMLLQGASAVAKALGMEGFNFSINAELYTQAQNGINAITKLLFDPEEVKAEGEKLIAEAESIWRKLENEQAGFILTQRGLNENKTTSTKSTSGSTSTQSAEKSTTEKKDPLDAINPATKRPYREELESLKAFQSAQTQAKLDQLNLEDQINTEAYEREKEAARKRIELKQYEEDAKYEIANQAVELANSLGIKSKAVANALLLIEKGLAISQIISNASRAIATATANLAATPAVIGVIPNPMYPVQAAATAKGIASTKISAGLSIANILAQTVTSLKGASSIKSGVSSAVGAGGVGNTIPRPQFNVAGDAGVNQIASTLANQKPIKAYVVGKEVSTQQSLDRNIVKNATLG